MALRKRSVGLRRPSPAKRGGSKSAAPASVEPLKRWLAEKGIRKAKVGGVDVDGVWRGKYISLDKLLSAAVGGLGFCDVVFGWDIADDLYDNSKVTGWHTGYPDAQARIDTSTARVIPWEPDVAAFLLDFVNADASPYEASPRQLLQKIGRRAREMGFLPRFGSEFEYFIFRETAQTLREKSFANLNPLTPGMFGYSWLRSSSNSALVHSIPEGAGELVFDIGVPPTEAGPGGYETAIRYDDLEKAGDQAVLFKTAVK